jgi:hypothetical protein
MTEYRRFECKKCGREVPEDRECPCGTRLWPFAAAGLVVAAFVIAALWYVMGRPMEPKAELQSGSFAGEAKLTLDSSGTMHDEDGMVRELVIAGVKVWPVKARGWLETHPRPMGKWHLALEHGEPVWQEDRIKAVSFCDCSATSGSTSLVIAPGSQASSLVNFSDNNINHDGFVGIDPVIVLRGLHERETVMVPEAAK